MIFMEIPIMASVARMDCEGIKMTCCHLNKNDNRFIRLTGKFGGK